MDEYKEDLQGLREKLRQTIRMMEDAVITDNRELIYMLVGKVGHIQSMIDVYEERLRESGQWD